MRIKMMPVAALKPYPNNPRRNEPAVAPVAKSIKAFGFRQPIVVDKDGVIVCGHTRYEAAKKLGLRAVPVHVAGDLTPTQVRAYRLADNKTNELAEWDTDSLQLELAELQQLDFDLDVLSFPEVELAELLSVGIQDQLDEADAVVPVPETAKSVPGCMYELGDHRLLVGDAARPEDVSRLVGVRQADILLTDPPYNVAYEGKTPQALKIENDSLVSDAFRRLLVAAFRNADSVMRPGAAFYIWHADSEGYDFRGACRDAGWVVRQCLIWAKNALVIGRQDYQWQHEPCLYGWKGGAPHGWYSDRSQTTLLRFDRPFRSIEHPTMKPVALFEYLLLNSSKKRQAVLDLFAGSGTTVIAAERAGRIGLAMELDPRYADVIRKRWAEFVHGDGCDWEALTPEVAD